jgi:anti-anti-sigma factor
MTITTEFKGSELVIALSGRLDTATSPQLELTLRESLEGISRLIFDFTDLDYISSAGLRVILAAQKAMNKQGTLALRGVKPAVMEVFEITGFAGILTFE